MKDRSVFNVITIYKIKKMQQNSKTILSKNIYTFISSQNKKAQHHSQKKNNIRLPKEPTT